MLQSFPFLSYLPNHAPSREERFQLAAPALRSPLEYRSPVMTQEGEGTADSAQSCQRGWADVHNKELIQKERLVEGQLLQAESQRVCGSLQRAKSKTFCPDLLPSRSSTLWYFQRRLQKPPIPVTIILDTRILQDLHTYVWDIVLIQLTMFPYRSTITLGTSFPSPHRTGAHSPATAHYGYLALWFLTCHP